MKKTPLIMFVLLALLSITLSAGTTGKLTGRTADTSIGYTLPFVKIALMDIIISGSPDTDVHSDIPNPPKGKYNKFQYVEYYPTFVEVLQTSGKNTSTKVISISSVFVEKETYLSNDIRSGKLILIGKITKNESFINSLT